MPRVAKPKVDIPKDVFCKSTIGGRVLAKAVNGKLLCGHRVITNTLAGIESWREFASIEEAAKVLGVPAPDNFGCPIIDKDHPRIDWSSYRGGYYIPKS